MHLLTVINIVFNPQSLATTIPVSTHLFILHISYKQKQVHVSDTHSFLWPNNNLLYVVSNR